jgi:hypothetical protein
MSPSAGGETAVEESESNGSVSGFSRSVCNHNKESMVPFVSSGEDNNEEGGEHSKDKGDYTEEEIPHIGEVTGAIQSKVFVVDTDLCKHEEGEHLISAIFPHKMVGLNLLSGVGHADLQGSVDSHYFANKSNMSVTSIEHSKQQSPASAPRS